MADLHERGAVGSIVIASIVALLIGGFGGYAIGMNNDMDSNSSMTGSSKNVDGVTVGGAVMVRDKDIVDNAAAADNVTTTVSLVDKAGLVSVLKGEGPFTVFGPDNDAFAKLDKATVDSLQKPENVEALKNILTYHVVAGTYTSADLRAMAAKGETLMTVQGQMLTPVIENNKVAIKDAMDNVVMIETADIISSNGVTHVVDSVLMPKS